MPSPIGGGTPILLIVIANTALVQSIPNNTDTIINFDTEVVDTHNAFITGTFTAPITGYYRINASVTFATTTAWAAGEQSNLFIYKNNVKYLGIDLRDGITATTHYHTLEGQAVVPLAIGDTINLQVFQLSGGALNLSGFQQHTWLNIQLI